MLSWRAVGVLVSMLVAAQALAAPRSSPLSPTELQPPETVPKSKQVTTTFKCTGYYKSHECENTLWLDNCKHSIKVSWSPLKIPGSVDWARTHRNWCSITYDGEDAVEERKLKPELCDGVMRLLAAALQGFPEVKWQDAQCTHIGTPDGILYVTQHYVRQVATPHFTPPKPDPDPDPVAVRLEDVRACKLYVDKRRFVRCPVLPQVVHSWLRKYLKYLSVDLVVQNEQK